MNIKIGDKVLYKSFITTSVGVVEKKVGDNYYIVNGMLLYSFEILKNLSNCTKLDKTSSGIMKV